jgi:hypothetical protein
MLYPSLTPRCIKAMRDTNFQGGRLGELVFIRCGRRLVSGEASQLAAMIRAATGDDADQVAAAHNPDFAENDYLRISTASRAYAFICHLKS